jgi:hypothetical protein
MIITHFTTPGAGFPFHPIPVKAEGQLHLLYELHLTNFHSQSQTTENDFVRG